MCRRREKGNNLQICNVFFLFEWCKEEKKTKLNRCRKQTKTKSLFIYSFCLVMLLHAKRAFILNLFISQGSHCTLLLITNHLYSYHFQAQVRKEVPWILPSMAFVTYGTCMYVLPPYSIDQAVGVGHHMVTQENWLLFLPYLLPIQISASHTFPIEGYVSNNRLANFYIIRILYKHGPMLQRHTHLGPPYPSSQSQTAFDVDETHTLVHNSPLNPVNTFDACETDTLIHNPLLNLQTAFVVASWQTRHLGT